MRGFGGGLHNHGTVGFAARAGAGSDLPRSRLSQHPQHPQTALPFSVHNKCVCVCVRV